MKFQLVCILILAIPCACATKVAVEDNHTPITQEQRALFSIDGEPVKPEEFLYMLSKNKSLIKENAPLTREEFEESFDLFLNFKLKVTEAEALGYHQTQEFEIEFGTFREDIRKPYLLENEVQEGELQRAYSRLQEIVKASHILLSFPSNASLDDSIAVLRMAEKIQSQAKNGADFGKLATEHSQDPSASVNNGALGYFTAMQMVYPFEAAAYDLRVGDISDPVLTDFGYHIIKLEDRKPNPGEIRVSHLLVRTNEEDPLSEVRAMRKIADIYDQLKQENNTWEDVVATFSEDQGTRGNKGLLPWFGVGNIVPEFEQAAFDLTAIGEISTPVKTSFGYHIIRLEDRKPVASFEELEQTLKSRILRDSRSNLIKSQVIAMQKARYSMHENETIYPRLEKVINSWEGKDPGALGQSLRDTDLWGEWLFSIAQDTLLVSDFHGFIEKELTGVRANKNTDFETWQESYMAASLKEAEERDLLENNEEYRLLLKEFREGILLFSLMNDLVWQKALNDSLGQLTYYETHLDRYQWAERVPALVVTIAQSDEATIRRLIDFLSKKTYDPKLKEHLEQSWLIENPLLFTVEDKIFEIEKHPVLKTLDLSNDFHDVTIQDKRYLLVTGKMIEKGPKKFEETKGLVIQDYQTYLDEKLVSELRGKYTVRVNEDEKNSIYQVAIK